MNPYIVELFPWSRHWEPTYRRPAIVACPCGKRRLLAREGESLRCAAECQSNVVRLQSKRAK